MNDQQFIKAIIEFFKGTQEGQPYQSNAIKRVGWALDKYRAGKFEGEI